MDGFIQIRRGLREHIRKGRFPPTALAVYIWLHLCADFRTGIQQNSARHIAFAMGNTISDRAAQRALLHLERHGYIKRFMTPGKRGDYPIAIDKYEVSCATEDGTMKKRLNAAATTGWRKPVYDSVTEYGMDDGTERGADSGGTLGGTSGDFVKKYGKKSSKKSGNNSFQKQNSCGGTGCSKIFAEQTGETPAPQDQNSLDVTVISVELL